MSNIFAPLPAPAANGPGAAVDMTAFGAVKTITVSNLAGSLVHIEISNDDAGVSWTPIATFQTVSEKTFQIACHWMRAVVLNYQGGGAPIVELGGTNDGTLFAQLDVPAGNGLGAPVDVSTLGVFKTVQVSGQVTGVVEVEVSEDGGATFSTAFSFSGGAEETQIIAASTMRVRRSGATSGTPLVNVAATTLGGGGGTGDVPTPPFGNDINITIFARTTGSDTLGNGKTIATAYRTFQRAIRDVPYLIPTGVFFIVDYTGIGVEVITDNFEIPSWKASHVFSPNFSDPFYEIQTAVVLRADPQLAAALPPSQQVILAGVQTFDPVTGILTITDASQAWPVGGLAGLLAYGTVGAQEFGVIYDNTATSILITTTDPMTFPVSIMEPSATLQGLYTQGAPFGGAVTCGAPDSLSICGTRIVDTGGFIGMYQQAGLIWFQGCDLPLFSGDTPFRMLPFRGCNLDNPNFGGETYISSCRVVNGGLFGLWLFRSANDGFSAFHGTVFDLCGTIQVTETTAADRVISFGGELTMSNILIRNSTSDAIYWPGGTPGILNSTIENSNGDAFIGRGGVFARLTNVSGSGNTNGGGTSVGVRSLDGAQIEVDGGTNVTGDFDQQVGSLAPGAYPVVPFNIPDYTGAAATGARLFGNP